MDNLRTKIEKELKLLEDMIKVDLEKEKIEKQRKIVDKLLKEYIKEK